MDPEFVFCEGIVEQPIPECRFRYKVECRTNSSILGVNSTPQNKTFPTIRIKSYVGLVQIEVSCVGKDYPYRPHPFRLVSRDTEDIGVFRTSAYITEERRTVQLQNMGIQCVRRDCIPAALLERQGLGADPFNTGFEHSTNLGKHHVRLAIQVTYDNGSRDVLLTNVITDLSSLHIVTNVPPSGSAHGGTKIVLLTKKFTKVTPSVWFATADWSAEAQVASVHMMCALTVITPPYRDPDTDVPVEVEIYLTRTSVEDDEVSTSNRVRFEYTPEPRVQPRPPAKRKKTEDKKLHPSLMSGNEENLSIDVSSLINLPIPLSQAEPVIDDNYFKDLNSLVDLDGILHNLLDPAINSQPFGSTPDHEPYTGSFSRNQPSTTSQPSTSMGPSSSRQTSIGPSLMELSPHRQNVTTDQVPITVGCTSFNKQTSDSRQLSSILEGQPHQNRQTSTDDLFSLMAQPSLHKKSSKTGQFFSKGQHYPHREMPKTGQSSSRQPSKHSQTSTTKQPSPNKQTIIGQSSIGQPSPNRQNFTTVQPSTSMEHPSSRSSAARLSLMEQNFLNKQMSSLMGQASQNRQFYATGQPSSSGCLPSLNTHIMTNTGHSSPNLQTSMSGQFSPMEQNLSNSGQLSAMQLLRNRQTPTPVMVTSPKPHIRPYFAQNPVSNSYDWRQSTSPGQDSPGPNYEFQPSSSGLGQMGQIDLQYLAHSPEIQQMDFEAPNIGLQLGEVLNATDISGLESGGALDLLSKSLDQLSSNK